MTWHIFLPLIHPACHEATVKGCRLRFLLK